VASSRFDGQSLHTGDAGFWHDGELYVAGRLGDSLKVRGRWLFMEDLEARLTRVEGLRRGRFVVFAGARGGRDTLVVLAEASPGPWADEAARVLADEAGEGVAVEVYCGGRGAIARTSSGKPRRRVMWNDFAAGRLNGELAGGEANELRAGRFERRTERPSATVPTE